MAEAAKEVNLTFETDSTNAIYWDWFEITKSWLASQSFDTKLTDRVVAHNLWAIYMYKHISRTRTIAYLNSPFLLNEFTILSWSPSLKFGPSSLITDKGFTIANSLEDVDLAVEPWLKKDPSLRLFPHFCHSLRFYWRQANCNPVDNKVWFHFWNWNSLLDHVRVQLKFFD